MKDSTKRGWSKFGWFCMSFVPMAGYMALMVLVTTAIYMLLMIFAFGRGETDIIGYLLKYTMHCGLAYALLGLVGFGLWYYFGCRQKKLSPPPGVLNVRNVGGILLTAFGAQFIISYLVMIFSMVIPSAVEEYSELMEMAGIDDVTLVMILYAVIFGPIVEEVIFRGVTLYYARKFTKRFWLANIVQALAFGIMHMNLIQGIYAFLLGLLLGGIYQRFHSLYASICMHMIFNLFGSGVLIFIDEQIPDLLPVQILWNVVAVVAFVVGLVLLFRQKGVEDRRGSF